MAESPKYRLVVLEGKNPGQAILLDHPQVNIGRAPVPPAAPPEGWIYFEEPLMANFQAVVTWLEEERAHIISNMAPFPPMLVNDIEVEDEWLEPGTRIQIAGLILEYQEAPAEIPEAEEAPAPGNLAGPAELEGPADILTGAAPLQDAEEILEGPPEAEEKEARRKAEEEAEPAAAGPRRGLVRRGDAPGGLRSRLHAAGPRLGGSKPFLSGGKPFIGGDKPMLGGGGTPPRPGLLRAEVAADGSDKPMLQRAPRTDAELTEGEKQARAERERRRREEEEARRKARREAAAQAKHARVRPAFPGGFPGAPPRKGVEAAPRPEKAQPSGDAGFLGGAPAVRPERGAGFPGAPPRRAFPGAPPQPEPAAEQGLVDTPARPERTQEEIADPRTPSQEEPAHQRPPGFTGAPPRPAERTLPPKQPPPERPSPSPTPQEAVEQQPRGYLVLTRGIRGHEGTVFPVYERETALGRSPECEVQIPDRRVSRLHAVITWQNGIPTLIHRSTTNRTDVNRKPVDAHVLQEGDTIRLAGRVELRWTGIFPG